MKSLEEFKNSLGKSIAQRMVGTSIDVETIAGIIVDETVAHLTSVGMGELSNEAIDGEWERLGKDEDVSFWGLAQFISYFSRWGYEQNAATHRTLKAINGASLTVNERQAEEIAELRERLSTNKSALKCPECSDTLLNMVGAKMADEITALKKQLAESEKAHDLTAKLRDEALDVCAKRITELEKENERLVNASLFVSFLLANKDYYEAKPHKMYTDVYLDLKERGLDPKDAP